MSAVEDIKAIQRILGVADDGDFGSLSDAALDQKKAAAKLESKKAVVADALPFLTKLDPRTEKNIETLLPKARPFFRMFMDRLIPHMAAKGVEAKIIDGSRTYAEQDEIYAQGRTKPGNKVTNARGGYSNHNFGLAVDIGLFKDGKYLENSPLYKEAGPIGESVGLEWGGRWKSPVDEPHFEVPTGLTLAEKRARTASGKPLL